MIYLDSAATTLQKPRTVPQAMQVAATRYASCLLYTSRCV